MIISKVQREAMGESEQKSPMWKGSTLARMMIFWAGKGFPLTLTLIQPPCAVNHDASTVSVCIRNNTPLLLQSEKKKSLNVFKGGSSRNRAQLDLTSDKKFLVLRFCCLAQ